MRTVIIGLTLCLVSCGGGSKGSGGGAPTNPTPPPQNRAPVITSVAVNPTFGIAYLTVFNFTATANDPDGDAIDYRWDLAGNPLSGPAPAHTFPGSGGQGTARVTVTDGRGGTSTGSVNFIVGSMEGTWAGNLVAALFRTTLQQSGGNVSGSFEILTPSGFRITGQTAPVSTNTIDASGRIRIRYKANLNVDDFRFEGTMDQTGVRITGAANGSGFRGQALNLVKQ
jgi:hypothetical protein